MNSTPNLRPALLFTVSIGFGLIGTVACSSTSDKSAVQEPGTIDVTLPAGVTIPNDLLPGTEDCKAAYVKFIAAIGAVYGGVGGTNFNAAFDDVRAQMPADLQDELAILSAAYQGYGEALAANNNDITSPDVQTALRALGSPEVATASQTVQEYFDATCPDGA